MLAPAFTHFHTATFACGARQHRLAVFDHAATGLRFHLLPGQPGFHAGDPDGLSNERRVDVVDIAPLLVGVTPLTRAAWRRIAPTEHPSGAGDLPVGGVSWFGARAWLTRAGNGLRLPTGAEWEFACRAGERAPWFFGPTWDPEWCWMLDNAGGAAQPVSRHADRANAFGLVDVAGNVSEWCEDDVDLPMAGSDWQEGDPGKVHRGGSFDYPSAHCRSAYRVGSDPRATYPDLGLRPVRSLQL